jgi:hypothetical protein
MFPTVTETKPSTQLPPKTKNADTEPLGSSNRSRCLVGMPHTRQKLQVLDRARPFVFQEDLPVQSHISPTDIPQLEQSNHITLEEGEQRGQSSGLNLEPPSFSNGKYPYSRIISKSFPYSGGIPSSMFHQTKSQSRQLNAGSVQTEGKALVAVPPQTTRSVMHILPTQGEVSGGVFLTEHGFHGSSGTSGPSSGCHKFPGVVKPKKQRHKRKKNKASARDCVPTHASTKEPLLGKRGFRAPGDSCPLASESSNDIVGQYVDFLFPVLGPACLQNKCNLRSVDHVDNHGNNLNTISEHSELKGEARIELRKRALELDEELSLLYEAIS